MDRFRDSLEILTGLIVLGLAGVVFICVALWWTGWESVLPEPIWEIVRLTAGIGGIVVIAFFGFLALRGD